MSRRQATHPGVARNCPTCHGLSYVVEREDQHAVASMCECVSECPRCRDTGFVARGQGFRAPKVRCSCRSVQERIRNFNAAGVPARHAHCTLVSFEPNRKVMPQFMKVQRYIKDYRPGEENRGLVLHGEVGRGKTHLMVATLRELVFRYGVTARFVEFSHLLADLKSTFDRGGGSQALLDPLTRVDVLAIDELGKGRNTEWEGTVLDELISRRYNAAATMLGTSNYAPGPATGVEVPNLADSGRKKESQPRLADRVGERVYSRLEEMCDFLPLKGGDYRLRHRPWAR